MATSQLTKRLTAFPRWWGGELSALVPQFVRHALLSPPTWTFFDLGEDEIEVRRSRAGKVEYFGQISLAESSVEQRRKIQNWRLDRRQWSHVLRLPQRLILRKTVELPLAAEENLRDVLSFEMDRQTPFKAPEVYFDYRLKERDAANQRIYVDLTVVRRQTVDRALELLRAWGLAPHVAVPQDDSDAPIGELNLLPQAARPKSNQAVRRLNILLFTITLMLSTAAIYQLFERQDRVFRTFQARAEAARQSAANVPAMRQELEHAIAEESFLARQKNNVAPMIVLLAEMTHALEDGTWVISLDLDRQTLRMNGYSKTASDVIGVIEASPMFEGARFAAPVVRDPRQGVDRFNITAQVVVGQPSFLKATRD